ncbi:MAG: AlpA family phage regulatory protein [Burkholderiaceae bacterium]|nr:AlpA family phage regulatory protein [Burkholderiaceae bacterium]
MQPRYLRIRELASTPARDGKPGRQGRYPVAPATIWRWVKRGEFPAPVSLGPQTTAWRVDQLDAWDAKRATGGQQ